MSVHSPFKHILVDDLKIIPRRVHDKITTYESDQEMYAGCKTSKLCDYDNSRILDILCYLVAIVHME